MQLFIKLWRTCSSINKYCLLGDFFHTMKLYKSWLLYKYKLFRGNVASFSTHGLQDTQYVQEQVYKVQIEVDRGKDVLLRGELVHDQVSVEYDEATEDDCSSNRDDKLHRLTPKENLRGKEGASTSISQLKVVFNGYSCLQAA